MLGAAGVAGVAEPKQPAERGLKSGETLYPDSNLGLVIDHRQALTDELSNSKDSPKAHL